MSETGTRKVGYLHTDRLPVSKNLTAYHLFLWEARAAPPETLATHRYIAVDDDLLRHFRMTAARDQIRAPAADVDRWIEATRALAERVVEIDRQKEQARYRQYPEFAPMWHRIWWMIRHPGGRSKMREAYLATCERLVDELATAYQTFDDRTADLADHIHAERERREEEERQQAKVRRWREGYERRERAAALGGPEDKIWSCHLMTYSVEERVFRIWVPALDRIYSTIYDRPLLRNVTAREVQAELARERDEHPYTPVHWGTDTSLAMRERRRNEYGDEVKTWKELTGVRIQEMPLPPRKSRDRRRTGTYGPSSTYGSDAGGGDYGSGGHTGGFGGTF